VPQTHPARFALAVALISISTVLASTRPARAQESDHFVMTRVTLAATGAVASSPTFDMRVSLGQAVPVGAVSRCNDGYHQTAGFWSLLGDQPVPTLLMVRNDPMNPGGVILDWTGSASQFDLYSSTTAPTLLDPGSFARSVFGCTTADRPPVTPRIYYQIVPSGP